MSVSDNNNLVSTFFIGETRWGIDTMNTQEVIKIPDITRVHHAPEYVVGIINLRGKIVTIISLATKLRIPSRGITNSSRIIIVNYNEEYIGLLVDRISDVLTADKEKLKPAPATVNGTKGHYFEGVYHNEDVTIAVLDLETVLIAEEEEI